MLVEKEICKDDLNGYLFFIINEEEMPDEMLIPLEERIKKERNWELYDSLCHARDVLIKKYTLKIDNMP